MTPRQRILAAFKREDVDRPPVMACFIRWMRGHYHCTSDLQQLVALEAFGFDPLFYHGSYLHNMTINDYIYKPDGNDAYRDLPDVNVDVRTENYKDRTIHKRRFETPAGVLTDRIMWGRPDMGFGDGPNPVREEPLVKTMADAEALQFILPLPRQSMIRDLRLFSEMVGERGVVEFSETAGAGSWGLEALGYENMLMCAAEQPELLKSVISTCHRQHMRNLKAVLESGHKHIVVSWFQCSASTGWSPAHIQELFLPLVRESVELVHSYDGLQWKREVNRDPFIVGSPGAWDAGCIGYMAMGSPLEIDDHYYFYTQGSNTLHGYRLISMEDKGRIALIMAARITKGRFIGYATGIHDPLERQSDVRVIPPYWKDRGMLMTRPFQLQCDKVFLNAKVLEGGSIAVEIRSGLDAAAAASSTTDAMKAYGQENANPIQNIDAIKIPVTFKDADLKSLRGQMIRLLVHLEKATVYGLSFE